MLRESPRILLQQLTRMFEVPGSNWRQTFDVDALEDIVVDLAGGDALREIDPERIELVTTFLEKDPRRDILLRETFPLLLQRPELHATAARLDQLFRPGQDRNSAGLRVERIAAVTVFVDALLGPLAERIDQVAHAAEERERYWRARQPQLDEEFEVSDVRIPSAETYWIAAEAAGRVVLALRHALTPQTFAALRLHLLRLGAASVVDAPPLGRSPATVSAALRAMKDLAEAECADFSCQARVLFISHLREELYHA